MRRHSIEKSTGNHGFSNPMFKHIYFNGLYKGFPEFSCIFSVIFQFYKIVNICPRLFSASPSGFPSEGDVFCTHRRKVQFINSPWPGNSQQHHLEEHDMPRFCSTQMWYSIQRTYASMHGLSWLLWGLPLQKITPPTRYHGFQRLQAYKKDRAVADGRTVPISFPLTNCPGEKHRFSGHPHRQFDVSWWVQLVSNSWCPNV